LSIDQEPERQRVIDMAIRGALAKDIEDGAIAEARSHDPRSALSDVDCVRSANWSDGMELKRAKGAMSESEPVNRQRSALDLKKRAALNRKAAAFFASDSQDRAERRAFDDVSGASWARE
jgi:hypothetical protein